MKDVRACFALDLLYDLYVCSPSQITHTHANTHNNNCTEQNTHTRVSNLFCCVLFALLCARASICMREYVSALRHSTRISALAAGCVKGKRVSHTRILTHADNTHARCLCFVCSAHSPREMAGNYGTFYIQYTSHASWNPAREIDSETVRARQARSV